MRRPYSERTCIVVKDLKDQPECKFLAIIEMLGERSAIACDAIIEGPHSVTLLRKKAITDPTDPKAATHEPVCAFSSKLKWNMMDRASMLLMSGEEWESDRVEDNKNQAGLFKSLYGSLKVMKVVELPNGKQVQIPVSEEEAEKAIKEASKMAAEQEEKRVYDDRPTYL